jgi:ubiquinone/menaquinone biosynthesis C-methylase UbiE
MISFVRNWFKTTKKHTQYWQNRIMDWDKDYLSSWNHPHRQFLSILLTRFPWMSLLEVGCASGPNLLNIVKNFQGKQVGGIDISEDAIDLAKKTFQGAFLKVGSVEDIMMSDNSTDVVLSDMALIYVSNPNKAIKEIKRVTRKYVLFSELHSESWYGRMRLRLTSGYHAHNYKKLLTKHGFYNLEFIKMTEKMWPGGNPQKDYGYFILGQKSKY